MKKKLLLIPLALILVVSLVACAAPAPAPAPVPAPTTTVTAPAATVTAPAATVTAPATTVTAPAPVPVEEVIEWRFHTPHTEGRTEFVVETDWADSITEASGGRLVVTIYPGRALGFQDADMLRLASRNVVQAFVSYGGYVSRDEPQLGLVVPEMVMRSNTERLKMFKYFAEEETALYKNWGILTFWWPNPLSYVSVLSEDPYNSIEAMQGKKIRVWELGQRLTMESLGIAAQVMSQGEIYLALKTGVLDGVLHTATGVISMGLSEVTSYLSTLYPTSYPIGTGVSEIAFNALPKDLQDIVLQVSAEHTQRWFDVENSPGGEQAELDRIERTEKEFGMTILDFSEADKITFSEAAMKVWLDTAQEVGPDAVAMVERLQAAMDRISSGLE